MKPNMKKQPDSPRSYEWLCGYDAGFNKPNTDNSHFSLFSTKEKTAEWEAGNKAGKETRVEGKKLLK